MKKHLNWTLFFGIMVIESYLLVMVMTDRYIEMSSSGFIVLAVITVLLEWSFVCWFLHQKKRSYAYLLATLIKPFYIPVGFIILLALHNNRIVNKIADIKSSEVLN